MLVKARQSAITTALGENRGNPFRFCKILNIELGLSSKRGNNTQGFSRIRSENGDIIEGEAAISYMSEYYAMN